MALCNGASYAITLRDECSHAVGIVLWGGEGYHTFAQKDERENSLCNFKYVAVGVGHVGIGQRHEEGVDQDAREHRLP